MTGSFQDRIPALSDEALRGILDGHAKYRREAVEAAAGELARRGLPLPGDRLATILGQVAHRDAGGAQARRPTFLRDASGPRLGRIRLLTAGILAAGLGAAAILYVRAARAAQAAPFDLEPQDSKSYLRQMEVVGGKANLVASDLRHGIAAAFQGTNLAWTLGILTLLTAALFWLVTTQPRTRP